MAKDYYIRFSNINSSFKCNRKQYKKLEKKKWRYDGKNITTDHVTEDGKKTTKVVNTYLREQGVKDYKLFSMKKICKTNRMKMRNQMDNRKK